VIIEADHTGQCEDTWLQCRRPEQCPDLTYSTDPARVASFNVCQNIRHALVDHTIPTQVFVIEVLKGGWIKHSPCK
jgi:hypothetical protein